MMMPRDGLDPHRNSILANFARLSTEPRRVTMNRGVDEGFSYSGARSRVGFELAGVTPALPASDRERYQRWVSNGYAGEMPYLTDRRAAVRDAPRNLLPSARSIICVGKLYNSPQPYSTRFREPELAWISRYAWGDDYHDVLRRGLEQLAESPARIRAIRVQDLRGYRAAARALLRAAGRSRLDRQEYLPDQPAERLLVLSGRASDFARTGARPAAARPLRLLPRCIDACPTAAIVPDGAAYALDSRLCIAYFTIELRGRRSGGISG